MMKISELSGTKQKKKCCSSSEQRTNVLKASTLVRCLLEVES
jgi:hypothetical protein